MEKHQLSKSTFIRGVQCLKSLYLNRKRPFLRDRLPPERLLVFRRGHQVGELARQLFPGGIDLSPGHPSAYKKAVALTMQRIAEGQHIIYEAGFQHDGVLVFLDILVKERDGWHAYEVKSSRSVSLTYLIDAALQYHVIKGSGLPLQSISIIHIDEEYVLQDRIEPNKLFKIVDVTADSLARQPFISGQVRKEKEVLGMAHSPEIAVGPHCRDPYECDFIGHCWKNIEVPGPLPLAEQFDMESVRGFRQMITGTTAFVKTLAIRSAIPIYRGTRPYQSLAFAFGILAEKSKDPVVTIAPRDENPEARIAAEMMERIKGIDTLVCFGEEAILRRLVPENMHIIDLRNAFGDQSSIHSLPEGTSLLDTLLGLTGNGGLPEGSKYTSDAICAGEYLGDGPTAELHDGLRHYLGTWIRCIGDLWNLAFRL